MENTTNNEVITKETEATSSEATSGTFPWKDDDVRVMTAGETAIGVGIIGGLSVLAWEAAIKPLGKKVLAAGKAALQKAKEKKAGMMRILFTFEMICATSIMKSSEI